MRHLHFRLRGTPNRIFNIEWRAVYYNAGSGTGNANFEVRLYEGQSRFDVIYGNLTNSNTKVPQPECKRTTQPLTSTILQRLRRCCYWRTKLHHHTVRKSDANAYS